MEIVTFYPEDESDLEVNASLSLDIIAVHGLNGNQINTWTEPKSKKLWLRDFLHKDLQVARIMSFGYNATAAFENSVAGIRDHARGLLGQLVEKREKSFEAKRPLIFIGHSLGGLVIKQALVIAEQETPYKQIYNNTLGIMFFGTPHQGSSIANYATTIARTLHLLAYKPPPELLESLRKGNPALEQLGDDWKRHHERRPYEIVSFYETRTMKGLNRLIVEKTSALLTPQVETPTWEDQIPVDATHRDMCRFATPKDKTYKTAIRCLKRIQKRSDIKVTNEFYVVPHSASSHFTGRNDIREQLSDSLLSYQNPKAQRRFVLYGLGGSGKTQISLKFAEDNRDSFWGIFWIDASSEDTAREGLLNLARACKQEENVDSVKAWLSRKDHWLLILDNADNLDLDVSKFFPSQERGTILITTRNPDLQKYGTRTETGITGSHCVDKLWPGDAVALLLKTAAVKEPQEENARQIAKQIVEELGFLALAIVQAGAVIRQGLCSLDGFCEIYSSQKREVLESGKSISSIEEYQYSVFTTWEISIAKIDEMLDDHAKLALELLKVFSFMHFDSIRKDIFKSAVENSVYATHAPGFKGSLLARLMPGEWNDLLWGKVMKLLLSFSLITSSHSGFISMHPLVHLWSRERMSISERADAWRTTTVTLSTSTTGHFADERKRQVLLPHIDSLLEQSDGQVTVSVQDDSGEWDRAIWCFHMAYTEGGQFHKALRISQAYLNSQESMLDPTNERHLSLRFLVGQNLGRLGRFREAVESLKPLMEDLRGSTYYTIIFQTVAFLGASYIRLKEYRTSLDLCTKAMADYEGISTAEDLWLLTIYNVLAEALCGLQRPKEALIWSKKAVVSAQKIFGPEHSRVYIAMGYLAWNYTAVRDFKKAYEWQQKCFDRMKEGLGTDHPSTIFAEGMLVNLIAERRRNILSRKKVICKRKELANKMRQQFGEGDCRTLEFQGYLALDYIACASFKKAKAIQEELVAVMTQEFGEGDKRTMAAMKDLARTKKWMKTQRAVYWWLPQYFLK